MEKLPSVVGFIEFSQDDQEVFAELLPAGEDPPRQKVGTLGMVNLNGGEVAIGALDEWLSANDRAPMYVSHNRATVPAGRWRGFELENNQHLYSKPYVNETTIGRDVEAAVRSGDFRGVSWTVTPITSQDYYYRPGSGNEPTDSLGEVLVVTRGRLSEVSYVVSPADLSARIRNKKVGQATASLAERVIQEVAAQQVAIQRIARKYSRRIQNG